MQPDTGVSLWDWEPVVCYGVSRGGLILISRHDLGAAMKRLLAQLCENVGGVKN